MLYVTRHGEASWNVQRKICGRSDVELTELGYQQAQALADKVAAAEPKVTQIICSPLQRARETARIVAEKNHLQVKLDECLIEMNFGKYDGASVDDLEFQNARKDFSLPFPEGESVLDVAGRIYPLLDELAGNTQETYLLVCHNAVSRVIDNYFHGKSMEDFVQFSLKNTQLMQYKFPRG